MNEEYGRPPVPIPLDVHRAGANRDSEQIGVDGSLHLGTG